MIIIIVNDCYAINYYYLHEWLLFISMIANDCCLYRRLLFTARVGNEPARGGPWGSCSIHLVQIKSWDIQMYATIPPRAATSCLVANSIHRRLSSITAIANDCCPIDDCQRWLPPSTITAHIDDCHRLLPHRRLPTIAATIDDCRRLLPTSTNANDCCHHRRLPPTSTIANDCYSHRRMPTIAAAIDDCHPHRWLPSIAAFIDDCCPHPRLPTIAAMIDDCQRLLPHRRLLFSSTIAIDCCHHRQS